MRNLLKALLGATLSLSAPFAVATIITFQASLDGAQERPVPNASTATGTSQIVLDTDLHTLAISVDFSGLIGGPAAVAHIHCCAGTDGAAGVAIGLTGFPSAASGSYSNTFDLTLAAIFNATFLANSGGTATSAETALTAGLLGGRAYVNIHNADFPGGEIRGQFSRVPVPGTLTLLGIAFCALGWSRRRT